MEQKLFTEIRPLYVTSREQPYEIRIRIRMRDLIDRNILRHAVDMTMERYPYFCVELQKKDGRYIFAENHRPVVITNSLHGVELNSEASNYHMIAFCLQDNWIILDVFHGLTDGTGAYEVVRTLLYYYCSERYDIRLNEAGIRLAGRPIVRPNVLAIEKLPGVTVERMSFFSSDGAQFPAVLLVPDAVTAQPTIICGDGPRASRIALARSVLAGGSPVLLPDLCGWGEIGRFARKFSAQAVPDETLAMTWYPLGRSLVGIRAENLIDCANVLNVRFGAPPRLVACGRAVIPAVHARFVAPAAFTDAVEMHDKPPAWADEIRTGAKANFADSVHGALAVYDWPML